MNDDEQEARSKKRTLLGVGTQLEAGWSDRAFAWHGLRGRNPRGQTGVDLLCRCRYGDGVMIGSRAWLPGALGLVLGALGVVVFPSAALSQAAVQQTTPEQQLEALGPEPTPGAGRAAGPGSGASSAPTSGAEVPAGDGSRSVGTAAGTPAVTPPAIGAATGPATGPAAAKVAGATPADPETTAAPHPSGATNPAPTDAAAAASLNAKDGSNTQPSAPDAAPGTVPGSAPGVSSSAEDGAEDPGLLAGLDPSELIARAMQAERELTSFESQLAVPAAVTELRDALRQQEPALAAAIGVAREAIAHDASWFLLADVRFELSLQLSQLESQLGPVEQFRVTVGSINDTVETLSKEWRRALESLREVQAPSTVVRAAERVVRRTHLLQIHLRRAQSAVALTTSQVQRMRGMVSDVLALMVSGGPALVRDFGYRGTLPFATAPPGLASLGQALGAAWEHAVRTAGQFFRASAGPLALQVLVFFALWVFARRGEASPDTERRTLFELGLIFRRPVASSALATVLFSLVLYPTVPASVGLLALTLGLAATSVLLLDERTQENRRFVVGGVVLAAFLYAHVALASLPDARRLLYGAEGLAVFSFTFGMGAFRVDRWTGGWRRMLRLVSRTWLVASGLGLLLWVSGFEIASAILIDGTARLMLVTVLFRVAYDVVASFVRSLIRTESAQASRMLGSRGELVADRLALLLRWALVFLWARAVLGIYTLRGPLVDALEGVLEKKLEVGSLSVTLGDGLALGIGALVAVYASRLTRFVLEEEVLPRTSLTLGSRAALTSSAGYVVLGLGLFMSLAAIGFELDKITILVSALGVGIGFGLQNIVQNFVAGIILIFGRPINVGDRVEVGGLVGTVREVGFRASTIKTFQGAEVIVPNSQFVSDQVINWSLTDDNRRIEVDVGVKYGTEPEQVIELLLQAAKGHPDVLAVPNPEALFMAFGASSLDFQLRAWTAKGSAWMNIRSDLTITVNRLLKEASIEIPFPQQDLNLRTVDRPFVQALQQAGVLAAER